MKLSTVLTLNEGTYPSLTAWEEAAKKAGYKVTKDNKSGTYHAWDGTTNKGSFKAGSGKGSLTEGLFDRFKKKAAPVPKRMPIDAEQRAFIIKYFPDQHNADVEYSPGKYVLPDSVRAVSGKGIVNFTNYDGNLTAHVAYHKSVDDANNRRATPLMHFDEPIAGPADMEKLVKMLNEGLAEADKHSFIGKIQRGSELKKKVDSTWGDAGAAQKKGDHPGAAKAFRKHERYANLEHPGTWTKVKEAAGEDMTGCKCTKCGKGTYQETSQLDDTDGVLHCTNCGMKVDRYKTVNEHIIKHGAGYRLVSKKTGKNLGDFPTKAAAEKHEREVEYFKHKNESVEEGANHDAWEDDYTDYSMRQGERGNPDRMRERMDNSGIQDAILNTVERLFRKHNINDSGALDAIRQGVKHYFSKSGATAESAIEGILNILDKRMRKNGNFMELGKFKEALRQGVSHQLNNQDVAEGKDPTIDSSQEARGFIRGDVKKLKDGSFCTTNLAGSRKIFKNEQAAKAHANSDNESVEESADPQDAKSKWTVTYDTYGSNKDVPLKKGATKTVYVDTADAACAEVKKLVGGRNHKAECIRKPV